MVIQSRRAWGARPARSVLFSDPANLDGVVCYPNRRITLGDASVQTSP